MSISRSSAFRNNINPDKVYVNYLNWLPRYISGIVLLFDKMLFSNIKILGINTDFLF